MDKDTTQPLIIGDAPEVTENTTKENTSPVMQMPEIDESSAEANLASLEDTMRNFDNTTHTTMTLRRALINKFLPEALNLDMQVTKATDPDMYQGQARFLSEVRQLLNDMDSTTKGHVQTKLKRVDLDQQRDNKIDPAALLAAIKLTQPLEINLNVVQPSHEEIDSKLEQRLAETGDSILDTELEMGGNNLPVEADEQD